MEVEQRPHRAAAASAAPGAGAGRAILLLDLDYFYCQVSPLPPQRMGRKHRPY
jgi:hypothetical protein